MWTRRANRRVASAGSGHALPPMIPSSRAYLRHDAVFGSRCEARFKAGNANREEDNLRDITHGVSRPSPDIHDFDPPDAMNPHGMESNRSVLARPLRRCSVGVPLVLLTTNATDGLTPFRTNFGVHMGRNLLG